jgi:predicted PurR-regulated permease PerM
LKIPQTLTIFALAALVAFGVAPATRDLERRMPRALAIAIVYSSLIIGLCVLGLLVVPSAVAQAQTMLSTAPDAANQLQTFMASLDHRLHGRLGPSYAAGLDQVRTMLADRMEGFTSEAVASLGVFVLQAFTAMFVLLSALVLSAFFVARADSIGASFRRLFPVDRRYLVEEFEQELARVFGGFVAGQVALCIVTAISVWIALTLLGAPFAMLVAVATGLGYAIPFVGMLAVQIGAAMLAVPEGWPMVVRVTIAIFAIARIVDTLLVPQVMSESVGVSPIVIMFAVFAGGEVFGVAGFAMGIPVAALAKTLWGFYQRARADQVFIISPKDA